MISPLVLPALREPAMSLRVTLSDGRSRVAASGFEFEPLRPQGEGVPLAELRLEPEEEMIRIERGGSALAFVAREMAYHHVAQGELAGEPYLVSF